MSDPRLRADSVPVRPAATVMLVRDGDTGLEVFMLQRTHSASFGRGQYVFPGGRVDDADHGEAFEPVCAGADDAEVSRRMGLAHGGLAWLVAAVRECFEEAGVLLARPSDGGAIVRFDDPEIAARFSAARGQVYAGDRSLVDLCVDEDLVLLTDELFLVDHWVTPLGERRRFDTRFFVTRAPAAQEPLHDDGETIASLWVRPSDALTMWRDGELQMFPPTVASLRFLGRFTTVDAAIDGARAIGIPPVVLPKLRVDELGRSSGIAHPSDPDFDDLSHAEFVVENPR